jgi:arylsulfatase
LAVWQAKPAPLEIPKLFNLRADPFETADKEGMDYTRWFLERAFVMVPAQQYIGKFLATFKEYPPSQKAGSFTLDRVLESLQQGGGNC